MFPSLTSGLLRRQPCPSPTLLIINSQVQSSGIAYACIIIYDRSFIGPIFRMAKIIKCASNDDSMVLKAEDDGDVLNMVFESPNGDR